MNYLALYNLEDYLFDTVRQRFQADGFLTAYDFFCIISWKANRAKSYVARRLLKQGHDNLDAAVYALTASLAERPSAKERLRYLWDWGGWEFRLPIASAILTVLYPEDFTVYDTRVCGVLNDFHSLGDVSVFEKLWPRYQDFKTAVERTAPEALTLRDKDRYLWGQSFHTQLVADIEQGFTKTIGED